MNPEKGDLDRREEGGGFNIWDSKVSPFQDIVTISTDTIQSVKNKLTSVAFLIDYL